ncbi:MULTISPECIES: hypothetical protein [Pantoea]|uniref:hypothetical protein n=1 Tax=Pantoea TaxID=53335 RepID=UPI00073E2A25|nr:MULTISPECIES: hypothetical protein [Pantoea]MDI6633082.1 hypothetical protein [Pantoea dispersa]NIE51216.1 hypothetical protein [Pantoea sp. Ap-870]
MSDLSIQEVHDYCLNLTQRIIKSFNWENITTGVLSEADKQSLAAGITGSKLNWAWGMKRYQGTANDKGILDISLKVVDYADPEALHAVIICKYDMLRDEFAICMLENFIADKETSLSGKVFIIALVYATTFCAMVGLDDVHICDPVPEAQTRYRSYGFAFVFDAPDKMSSSVEEIQDKIREKVRRFF